MRTVEARFAPDPQFLIVGTGRSGTRYIAKVLTDGGIRCGHEEIFGPEGIKRTWRLEGDSSWLAVPYLPEYEGLVLHQVRDPIAVVRSLVGIRFFEKPSTFLTFLRQWHSDSGDPLIDSMRFYVDWNQRCEASAQLTYRLEDLPGALPEVTDLIDGDKKSTVLAAAERVPNTYNSRQREESIQSWADLPDGPERDRLAEMATRYGYSLDGMQGS